MIDPNLPWTLRDVEYMQILNREWARAIDAMRACHYQEALQAIGMATLAHAALSHKLPQVQADLEQLLMMAIEAELSLAIMEAGGLMGPKNEEVQ